MLLTAGLHLLFILAVAVRFQRVCRKDDKIFENVPQYGKCKRWQDVATRHRFNDYERAFSPALEC